MAEDVTLFKKFLGLPVDHTRVKLKFKLLSRVFRGLHAQAHQVTSGRPGISGFHTSAQWFLCLDRPLSPGAEPSSFNSQGILLLGRLLEHLKVSGRRVPALSEVRRSGSKLSSTNLPCFQTPPQSMKVTVPPHWVVGG